MFKAIVIQRACEFVLGVVVEAVVILLFPAVYLGAGGAGTIAAAFGGALVEWGIFYVPLLYVFVSSGVSMFVYSLGAPMSVIAFSSAVVFMVEAGAIGYLFPATPMPASFWVAWLILGLSYFVIGLAVLPLGKRSHQ